MGFEKQLDAKMEKLGYVASEYGIDYNHNTNKNVLFLKDSTANEKTYKELAEKLNSNGDFNAEFSRHRGGSLEFNDVTKPEEPMSDKQVVSESAAADFLDIMDGAKESKFARHNLFNEDEAEKTEAPKISVDEMLSAIRDYINNGKDNAAYGKYHKIVQRINDLYNEVKSK